MYYRNAIGFLFILFLINGCSLKVQPSGFLSEYSEFKESDDVKGLYIDHIPDGKMKEYSKILIEKVVVFFQPEARGADISPEKLDALSDFLENELKEVFKDEYSIVKEPGEGVLVLKTAITEVVTNKPILNIAPHHTLALGIGLGGAAMEAEFCDSLSDRRVLAVRYGRKGRRRKYFKGWKKWGHTEDVLMQWAKILYDEQKKFFGGKDHS